MSPNRIAALLVFVLGAYLQFVEWVDLFPWNDVRNGNGQEALDLALGAATVILVGWLWVGGRLAAAAATVALGAWAYLQIETWWRPYVLGASASWKRVWDKWFSETIHILPITEERRPPDANHLVLQALILIALAAALRALIKRRA